ncbi:Pten 3-phosphoinositide phosphatase alpha [Hyphodiscus hymeniophilus]|uniref:phosphatidylinositol-3,4,5-trisphosphate 3-phosphatase n=1 Tax=Hyphodiscus hymeniophilus TaxID=353542 RepID=A0A9P6VK14_9HELO|nr:Pten 3-phosphoinositide phosphatase alpha [Hyphodiscus hymeniophilus]
MASLLRQIVASPRTRHPEAGLDLCYVTDQIIATSGPSGTYPQRAYRNPLDQLVKFLDFKHGKDWAIWEFRAEGTGYPDDEVYGRINHYPWPDHHPPPFRLVPMIMAGMRNWLREEPQQGEEKGQARKGRVVVVHCKAGKGRSGTMACSYLISECGWKASEALARFTERRMRPGFGQGVSIPSQLRWVGYVDRWTSSGKLYVERQIEIMEVHVWSLRDGVKVQVEGYVDEGKTIKLFHVFTKKERVVVEGPAPGGRVFTDTMSDMAESRSEGTVPESKNVNTLDRANDSELQPPVARGSSASLETAGTETGGGAVVFKPSTRVILPTSDINIDFERRNKASMGWTMVTAVAHVWFNAYFEGNGPEQNGMTDDSGVFEIEWDRMDGIKGSSRKGMRAFDRLAVVWKAYDPEPGQGRNEDVIHEPGIDSPVPQMQPADWKGGNATSPGMGKDLGLRTESPVSVNVSKASSMKSSIGKDAEDDSSIEGVKSSGPAGDETLDADLSDLPQPKSDAPEPDLADINAGLDTASITIPQSGSELPDSATRTDMDPETEALARGVSQISTKDLPDGKPEDQLKDARDHHLGDFSSAKKTIDS